MEDWFPLARYTLRAEELNMLSIINPFLCKLVFKLKCLLIEPLVISHKITGEV